MAESTVSPADVRAVLTALGTIVADYMTQGRSVKLDGIGSFYFTAVTAKGGVDKEEKVTANQIMGVRVRFNPETRFTKNGLGTGKHATRDLIDAAIEWEEWKGEDKKEEEKRKGRNGDSRELKTERFYSCRRNDERVKRYRPTVTGMLFILLLCNSNL